MARLKLIDRKRLLKQITALQQAGAEMSNVCFNLAQDDKQPPHLRKTFNLPEKLGRLRPSANRGIETPVMIDLKKLKEKGVDQKKWKAAFTKKSPSKQVQRLKDRIFVGRRKN